MTPGISIGPILDRGNVSALLLEPGSAAAMLVLAHGAGAGMTHPHMEALAEALGDEGIATLRFNFPGREAGHGRPDRMPVCLAAIDAAVAHAREARPDLALFLGGHSFGGRMASHHAVDTGTDPALRGLVFYSFPLHPPKKPGTDRAAHLGEVRQPMLFLSGTRDALAAPELLESTVGGLNLSTLHWLDTADHGFKVLKRSRRSPEDVYVEAARVSREFVDRCL